MTQIDIFAPPSTNTHCVVDGCDAPIKVKTRNLCGRHYQRWWSTGDPEEPSRTDPRPIKTLTDYALVPLGVQAKHGYAIIDLADVQLIGEYKWTYDGRYAVAQVNSRLTYMHHFLLGHPTEGLVIDHINRNKLDNRRSNLRQTTRQVNGLNADRKPTLSGHVGVTWDAQRAKWYAQIRVRGTTYNLGRYDQLDEAITARHQAEEKHHIRELLEIGSSS